MRCAAVFSLTTFIILAGLAVVPAAGQAQVGTGAAATSGAAGSSTPGTSSLGTAQSSGAASGKRAKGAFGSTDAAVRAQNRVLDTKLKSICRGC